MIHGGVNSRVCPETTLADALEFLRRLNTEHVRPDEGQERIKSLAALHPGIRFDLLWDMEPYDGSVHYDALLRADDETLSISLSTSESLPWPLRGAHRWSESAMLRVDGTVLSAEEVVSCLDFLLADTAVARHLVDVCLIKEGLEEYSCEVSDSEVQAAVDEFRCARGLFTKESTRVWMQRKGIDEDRLRRYGEEAAAVKKLRCQVTSANIEGYFEAHREKFESALILETSGLDWCVMRQFAEMLSGHHNLGEFGSVLHKAAHTDAVLLRSVVHTIFRSGLEPSVAEAVFAADPVAVVGPLIVDEHFVVAAVISRAEPRLDDTTKNEIEKILFDQWLDVKRQCACIEWYWGRKE